MLAGFAWEEDDARLVGLEALDVQSEGFLVGVEAAGVEGDADSGGEFARDAGFLWEEVLVYDVVRVCLRRWLNGWNESFVENWTGSIPH